MLQKTDELPLYDTRSSWEYDSRMFDALHDRLHSEGTVTFPVRVRPGAAQTACTGMLADGSLKIAVAAAPEDGKANALLTRFLALQFGVRPAQVEIITGSTGRRKIVRIALRGSGCDSRSTSG